MMSCGHQMVRLTLWSPLNWFLTSTLCMVIVGMGMKWGCGWRRVWGRGGGGGVECTITMTSYWVRWRLKSPVSRLFAQPFVQAQIKENIKAPRHWPLWGNPPLTGGNLVHISPIVLRHATCFIFFNEISKCNLYWNWNHITQIVVIDFLSRKYN